MNLILIAIIILAIVGIPLVILNYQARRTGLTMSEVLRRAVGSSKSENRSAESFGQEQTGERIDFLEPIPIGFDFTEPPMISHLQPVDLDGDRFMDVIVCDVRARDLYSSPPGQSYVQTWLKDLPERIMPGSANQNIIGFIPNDLFVLNFIMLRK